MKRFLTALCVIALIAALSVAAVADSWTMYVTKDGTKVYSDWDKSSKVLTKLNACDSVKALDVTMNAEWYQVQVKVKGKKKTGYIQGKYLSADFPASKCHHEWSKWQVTEEPTCTSKGRRERYCKKCGILDEGEIAKADHEYGKWKVLEEATCTEKGEKVRTCKVCGHKQTKEIPKTEHEYGKWKVTKEPTCTSTGKRYRVCRECGHKDEEVINKLPHDFGEWTVLREATCSEVGLRTHTCRDCGYEEKKEIEKLPHTMKWEIIVEATDHSSGTRRKVCQVCGYSEEAVSYDPKGTLRRKDRGDDVRELQQLLADQGYLKGSTVDGIFGPGVEQSVKQFQADQGLEPDGVAWPQTIKRLKHEYGPWQTTIPLTRTSDGERVHVCTECGYEQRETVKAAPDYPRKSRGEDVRAIQQMINSLGYNSGAADGIYGQKLDNAFEAFAADHGVAFTAGNVSPADVDALVNAWMSEQSENSWKGEGGVESPVGLSLSVSPVSDAENGDLRTYEWTLTNLGTDKCKFTALLLSFGDAPDFRENTYTLVIDNFDLKGNCGNSATGTFSVSTDWGEGDLNFRAIATIEKTGDIWSSNIVTF